MTRIALLSFVLLPLAVAAQMYKWVDEKGVTHYSESPPPDGKGSKVELKSSGPAGPVTAPDWKKRELESRRQRIQKEQVEEQQRAREHNAAATRRNNCLEAQRELSIVQSARPVYHVNEKGERLYLEDKDRQREIDGWKEHVRKNCD